MFRSRSERMRATRIADVRVFVCVTLVAGACGGGAPSSDPSAPEPTAHLPSEYALRLDRQNRVPEDFSVIPSDRGLHVQTGPAGILYRPDDVVEAHPYQVSAEFTEVSAPMGHREGFGLFIAGQDLQGDGQRYLYFLVRGDGRYLIKRRDGTSTDELSNGWQPSEALNRPVPGDDVTNELAISVDGDALRFLCNGEEVAELPARELDTDGVVGVRVNHNLQVRIQDFSIE